MNQKHAQAKSAAKRKHQSPPPVPRLHEIEHPLKPGVIINTRPGVKPAPLKVEAQSIKFKFGTSNIGHTKTGRTVVIGASFGAMERRLFTEMIKQQERPPFVPNHFTPNYALRVSDGVARWVPVALRSNRKDLAKV